METKSYEIQSWDGIIAGCLNLPLTSISIVPDLAFIEQLSLNTNNLLQVKITGTNSLYDKTWIAVADKSANIPNCRPNFYQQYGLYVLTLQDCSWQGEPSSYGTVSIVNTPYINYSRTCQPTASTGTKSEIVRLNSEATPLTLIQNSEDKNDSIDQKTKDQVISSNPEVSKEEHEKMMKNIKIEKQKEIQSSKLKIFIYIAIALIFLALIFIGLYVFNSNKVVNNLRF